MKRSIFSISLIFTTILFVSHSFSQDEIHLFQSPDKVTVFQSGAMITHNYKVKLNEGSNILQLDSLPQAIDGKSIRISMPIKTTVLSNDFKYNANNNKPIEYPKSILKLEDSLRNYENQINEINGLIVILNEEQKIIQNFKLEGGKEKAITVEDLTKFAQFYELKLTEIKKSLLKYHLQLTDLTKLKNDLIKKIAEMKEPYRKNPFYYIETIVNAEEAGIYNLELTYFANNAGWTPYYDLRANGLDKPIDIIYKANAWQKTGYDWKDVELTLSTRNPNMNNVLPILSPWYLRIYQPQVTYYEQDSPLSLREDKVSSVLTKDLRGSGDANVIGTVDNKYFSEEYKPSAKYSLKSDGLKKSITLNHEEMEATFEYYTAPELDLDAFLTAKVANWGQYRLLPGEANVYFEDSYVGKSYIDPASGTDTLQLSLGRDKGLVIKREMQKDMTETKFLSNNVQKTFAWKISIINLKKNNIKITMQERIPVSTHEDIEVKLLEKSGADFDKETGYLKWYLELEPNKNIEKTFIYKVDAPKGTI
ncbi:MAG: hypothetical protein A2X64_07800 [Ignavibacteria bacterium GWF2_33_9]|nr:MAG: hypothetical protein A2X64_07800 [Ignavibacteria bacterium GWF2_33_9]